MMNFMTSSDGPRGRLQRQEIEAVLNDPAVRSQVDTDPKVIARQKLYDEAAEGLLADLRKAGFAVGNIREMLGERIACPGAIPMLLDWLPRARYLMLAWDIVGALRVKTISAQKLVVPELVRLFREPPEVEDPLRPPTSEPAKEALRDAIASALGDLAAPFAADDLIELATDRHFGERRGLIVLGLPKTKDERVPDVLLSLLQDPTVAAFAIKALGQMKHIAARERIQELLDSSDPNIRNQAKKTLKRLC